MNDECVSLPIEITYQKIRNVAKEAIGVITGDQARAFLVLFQDELQTEIEQTIRSFITRKLV